MTIALEKAEEKQEGDSVFKQLLTQYFKGKPKVGDVVQGTILAVSKSEVRLDIGGLMIGVVRFRELLGQDYTGLEVGATIEATVLEEENENGEMELSFRAAGQVRAWDTARDMAKSMVTIDAKVIEANKGGLMVSLGALSGFLPVSQLGPDNYPRVPGGDKNKILEHLRQFAGKTIRVKVMDVSEKDEKLIVSQKMVWEEEQKDVLGKYAIGDMVEGKVSALTSFGAFVAFDDGLEGLIHISEIAWQRIDHPRDLLKAGDEVKAQVIQIDGSKIFLSMKRLMDDPWKTVKEKYKIGDVVSGKIIKINPFGLFVELDPQIHGLAHISELSNDQVSDITAFANPGDVKEFEVVSIEPAAHRLGLRIAGVTPKEIEKKEEKEEDKKVEEEAPTAEPVAEAEEAGKE